MASDEERRAAVASAYTAKLEAVVPQIRARLQALDPGIDVRTPSNDTTTHSHCGRYLASRTTPSDYGGRLAAMMPNHASNFVLLVQWDGCVDGIPPPGTRLIVERYLNSALPAWVDYIIYTNTRFHLDGVGLDGSHSHLDLSCVG